jgi:uncharacterized membrane-anchored protein YhcB (DUF1043 family)
MPSDFWWAGAVSGFIAGLIIGLLVGILTEADFRRRKEGGR